MAGLLEELNRVKTELEVNVESGRLDVAAYKEMNEELTEMRLRSIEQTRLLRLLQDKVFLSGYTAKVIDEEIASMSKELDVLEQQEGTEHPSYLAQVTRLDRIIWIRDELKRSSSQDSQGERPESSARSPYPTFRPMTRSRHSLRGMRKSPSGLTRSKLLFAASTNELVETKATLHLRDQEISVLQVVAAESDKEIMRLWDEIDGMRRKLLKALRNHQSTLEFFRDRSQDLVNDALHLWKKTNEELESVKNPPLLLDHKISDSVTP